MPGPRYVKDFKFPSSFGFSGSASDRTTVPVRGYERQKPVRLAKGGRALTQIEREGVESENKGTPEPRMSFESYDLIYGKGRRKPTDRKDKEAAPKDRDEYVSTTDLVRGKARRLREQELGLKKGGSVRRAVGGPVKASKGGDISQDRKLVKSAIAKHVRAPKPRGHGVK